MRESDPRAEFEQFRKHGDVAALARVFDTVAPDLMRLARVLARDVDSPEDFVQATFLTAIESRDTFDATRPLEPWLAGILANHVFVARRRAARASSSNAMSAHPWPMQHDAASASDLAIEREVWTSVTHAIDHLPASYREVVVPRLLRGERASDVAKSIGRPPGAVRMRLQRALSLLRRSLPRGLTATFALFALSRTSRAAVLSSLRARVLGHATSGHSLPPLSTLSPTSSGLSKTGAWLMSKKILLSLAVIALAAVGYVFTGADPSDGGAAPSNAARAPLVASESPSVAPTPLRSEPERSLVAAEPSPPTSPGVAAPASYTRALAGLRGRLLEADGSPVANTTLALVEFDSPSLINDLVGAFRDATIDPFVGETKTDGGGRFQFDGVFPRGLHALGIDLGGKRATLRMVDLPLAASETTDLGDVVLGPVHGITGKIVDDDGKPVADARVRAACLPAPIARLGVERLTTKSRVLSLRADGQRVIELPRWAQRVIDRLPFPTTKTDGDGRFELTGIAGGNVTLLVDHDRFAPTAFGPTATGKRGAGATKKEDFGTLAIAPGRTVSGRVLDGQGKPLARAIVIGGTDCGIGTFALTSNEAATDDAGRFTLRALPEEGRTYFAARSESLASWTIVESVADDVEIQLAGTISHELHVTRADGHLVNAIELRASPARPPSSVIEFQSPLVDVSKSLRCDRPGVFTITGLAAGDYDGLLRAIDPDHPTLGPYSFSFAVSADGGATSVEIPSGRRLEVHVRESLAQSAVEHASVAAMVTTDARKSPAAVFGVRVPSALALARSDVRGIAILDGIALPGDQAMRVRVDHPRYGASEIQVEPGAASVDVVLEPPSAFIGHLRTAGVAPTKRFTLMIFPGVRAGKLDDSLELPRFVTSDAAGDVHASGLAPGNYEYEIVSDLLTQDLTTLSARAATDFRKLEPELIARGNFEVAAGRTTEITIEIAPSGAATNATLVGRITEGGAPMKTAILQISPNPLRRFTKIESDGTYRAENLPPGAYTVEVYAGVDMPEGTMLTPRSRKQVELGPGEQRALDFEFESHPLVVRVVQASAPIAGAAVRAIARHASQGGPNSTAQNSVSAIPGMTKDSGEAELSLGQIGEHDIYATHPLHGYGHATVNLRGDGSDANLTIDLDPGVTLTATYDVASELGALDETCSIVIDSYDSHYAVYRTLPVDPKSPSLRCEHLPPGKFTLSLERRTPQGNGSEILTSSKPVEVEAGSSNVHVHFEAR